MYNKTVYFLIDCSRSMSGNCLETLNTVMRQFVNEAVPLIKAQQNDYSNIMFKVFGFNGNASGNVFVLLPETKLDNFTQWNDIGEGMLDSGTPTGAAIRSVIQDIQGGNHGEPDANALAPVIILISDGLSNGSNPTYEEMLECAVKGGSKEVKVFRKAPRFAIGINADEEGRRNLQKFGSVSNKMSSMGITSYYDCTEDYLEKLVNIICPNW